MNFFVVFVIVGACAVTAVPTPSAAPAPAAEAPQPEAEPAEEAQREKRSHPSYGGSYGAAAIAPASYGGSSYAAPIAAPASYGAPAASYGAPAISSYAAPISSPSYSSGSYVSPCAASAPLFASAPLLNLGGHGLGYGGSAPHYRAADEQDETINFSDADHVDQNDMEHMPLARSYGYDLAPAASGLSGLSSLGGQAVATGPAFGVFSNANLGGCNLPLLVSCSPSVVPGRLVRAQAHYAQPAHYAPAPVHYAPAPAPALAPIPLAPVAIAGGAYRGADEHPEAHDEHSQHQQHPHQHEHELTSETRPQRLAVYKY